MCVAVGSKWTKFHVPYRNTKARRAFGSKVASRSGVGASSRHRHVGELILCADVLSAEFC